MASPIQDPGKSGVMEGVAGYCTVMTRAPMVVERPPESIATTVTTCSPTDSDAAEYRSL